MIITNQSIEKRPKMDKRQLVKTPLVIISLMCVLQCSLQAQRFIKGYVKHADTKKPIPHATVFLKQKKLGTTTDSTGYFKLRIEQWPEGDSLLFRHLSFRNINVPVKKFLGKESTLYLKTQTIALDGVSVKPASVEAFMAKIRREYLNSRPNYVNAARVYVRDYARNKRRHLFYNDAVGYMLVIPPDTLRKKGFIPVYSHALISEQMRKSLRRSAWKKYVSVFERKFNLAAATDVYSGFSDIANAIGWFNQRSPLSPDTVWMKRHKFKYRPYEKSSRYIAVDFATRSIFPGKYYKGTFYLNKYNMEIAHVTFNKFRIYNTIRNKFVNGYGHIDFHKYQGNYYVNELSIQFTDKGLERRFYLKVLEQQTTNLAISYENYGDLAHFMRNPLVFYSNDFWRNFKLPRPFPFNQLKKDIPSMPLHKQFAYNDHKPFLKIVDLTGTNNDEAHEKLYPEYENVLDILKTIKSYF